METARERLASEIETKLERQRSDSGNDSEPARQQLDSGIESKLERQRLDSGMDSKPARQRLDSGIDDSKSARQWLDSGIDSKLEGQWSDSGIDSNLERQLLISGMDSKPTIQRLDSGINLKLEQLRLGSDMESFQACCLDYDDDVLKTINDMHILDSENGENFKHPNLWSTPKKTISVRHSSSPVEERVSCVFQRDKVFNNPTEVERCPGPSARPKQEPWENECNIDFRSRRDSGYGSFSDHTYLNSSNKCHNRLPDDNIQHIESNSLSHVTGTINQRSLDVANLNCFANQTTGTGRRRSLKDILQCLLHDGPAYNIGSSENCVYVEHSEIVSISPETLTIQDSSSILPSQYVVPIPNEYQSISIAGEDDEINESNTSVSQHNDKQNLDEIGQQCDLVSMKEGKDGMCLIVVVKNAGCLVVGNNTTVNHSTLKLEDASKNNNVTFAITPEALSNIIKNDPRNIPSALKRSGSIAGKRYIHIMECMKKYQDSGYTHELESFAKAMVNKLKKDEIDLKIVILLERALYFIYQKNLKEAKLAIDEAMHMATSANNESFLLGRCHIFLAHILLYEEKYTETLECLENASTFLENFVSGEDKAFCCYLYGYTHLKMADEWNEPCPDLEAKALTYFQMAIHHAREDPESRVLEKKTRYCLFKQISVYLRTYSAKSKQLPVEEKEIEQAKHLLDHFDNQYLDNSPPGTRVHFFAFESDYYFRKKRFKRAIGILEGEGLKTARSVGHKPLLHMVNDRIKYLTPFEEEMEEASKPDVNNDIDKFDELDD